MRETQHRRIAGRLVIATHNPGKLAEMLALARAGVAELTRAQRAALGLA